MPLFSKALPFQGCPPLWGPFCDGPSPRWPQPFARSFDSRVFPSPCVSFHPHHPLSHVISPNRIQSHRIALLGWQKDLTLQHEHDSWVGPPPDWPQQTPASPAESMSPRSLTYWHTKDGPNQWQARCPLSPKARREIPYVSSRRKSSAWRASSSPTVCCILAW